MPIPVHDGGNIDWIQRIITAIQQFIVFWAAVHAGNKTALKPVIEASERKVKK